MEKLNNISFDSKYIYAEDASGRKLKQSLLWYPTLMNASDEQRNKYEIGFTGFHWRELDEDISFESFEYDEPEPTGVSYVFLSHPELNASAIARRIGISQSLMSQYINGMKKPSQERERLILDEVNKIGHELISL